MKQTRPQPKPKPRDSRVTVRFAPHEREFLQRKADARMVELSAYIRERVLAYDATA